MSNLHTDFLTLFPGSPSPFLTFSHARTNVMREKLHMKTW